MKPLLTEPYATQADRWPRAGRRVLAQFDAETVVVYQAYRPEIARFAVANQALGGPGFSFARMSWIKPNFLWMMFRCGWATKPDQEAVLALRLRRAAFDALLVEAVPSTSGMVPGRWSSEAEWKAAVSASSVRLQWDPDHHPGGAPLERRALQLGLRGAALQGLAREWLVSVEDVTDLVRAQRPHVEARAWQRLELPREDVYPVRPEAALALGM